MKPFQRLPAGAFVLALLLSACSSTGEVPEGPPLPFHVALIPTEIHDTSVLTDTPSEPVWAEPAPGSPADDMRLELATSELSHALCDELASAFVRTTLLELPADRAQLLALSPGERERYWQERARAAGADLLMRTRLLVDPAVDGERNEKFWLNLPLFLLGGPACYFVGDRSYVAAARLQAEVFDVSKGHETLGDYALLRIPLYAEFQGADLRFIDRAHGAWQYAFSLLIPSGLLARETETIESELEQRLPVALGRELTAKVLDVRAQFEQNPALGGFKLEAQAARLDPGEAGRLRLRVPVQELTLAGALHRYEVRAGETVLSRRDFPTGAAVDGRRYIDEDIALPAGAEFLTVRVMDADANTRSYTLRVQALAP
jgi:hypothetical protein